VRETKREREGKEEGKREIGREGEVWRFLFFVLFFY
jgi:hypothetical protein